MIHFHNLTVKKVVSETDDCVSVTFSVPDDLKDAFRFKPGQSLTFRKQLGGEEVRRSYSICSAPADGMLQVAIKKVEGGLFSTWANDAFTTRRCAGGNAARWKLWYRITSGHKKNRM